MNNISFSKNYHNSNYPLSSSSEQGSVSNLHYNLLHNGPYDEYKKRQERKTRNLVVLFSSSTFIIGGITVLLLTGRVNNISHKIQDLIAKSSAKIDHVKNKHLHKFLNKIAGGFERISKITPNFVTIKDYSLYKVMDKTKLTRNLRVQIERLFTKENVSTVTRNRKKAINSFEKLVDTFDNAIQRSEQNPSLIKNAAKFAELKKYLQKHRELPLFLSDNFNKNSHVSIENDMNYLLQNFTFKRLTSKEIMDGFVAENILMERRSNFAKNIFNTRNEFSCSFSDLSQFARDKLKTTNILIYSVKDIQAQRNLRNCSVELDSSLKHYLKDSLVNKENREVNREAVKNSIQNFNDAINSLPESKAKQKLVENMSEYKTLFDTDKKGVLQNLRILAGEAWGDATELDKTIKKATGKHSKNLDEMLEAMINMHDKQRDITLGSGPADVLGLLVPVGYYGYELKKDKTKDERIGTSLELGIPLVGGTGVYLWTLTRQFNGFNALATTLGSGLIFNTLGSEIFKHYQSSQKAK